MKIQVGCTIKVKAGHWWRAHEEAVVTSIAKDGRCACVFDSVGIGYDGGTTLNLTPADFDVIEEAPKPRKGSKEDK